MAIHKTCKKSLIGVFVFTMIKGLYTIIHLLEVRRVDLDDVGVVLEAQIPQEEVRREERQHICV